MLRITRNQRISSCFTHIIRGLSVVITETIGSVQMISINRPEKRNAVNNNTATELRKAFQEFEDNSDLRSAVLYGQGGTFCAGYDLEELSKLDIDEIDLQHGPMGPTKQFCNKPVIAAIEGHAVAGGMELALWCDLRVMDDTAIMGVFCRRFGVPLIDGGTVRLPKLIGLSRALDLILTGREVRAKEALDIGLVNRICDTGTAVGRALLLAQEISKFPPECLLTDRKSASHSAYNLNIEQSLDYETKHGRGVLVTESVPGARAFVEGIGRHGSFNLRKKTS